MVDVEVFPSYLFQYGCSPKSPAACLHFDMAKQEGHEDVRQFANRLRSLYLHAYGDEDCYRNQMLTRQFMRNLKDPAAWRNVHEKNPETFEEAVSAARAFDTWPPATTEATNRTPFTDYQPDFRGLPRSLAAQFQFDMEARQANNESVLRYALRLYHVYVHAFGKEKLQEDLVLIRKFVYGLNNSTVRMEILIKGIPETFTAAVSKAMDTYLLIEGIETLHAV